MICSKQRYKAILRQHPKLRTLAQVEVAIVSDDDWQIITPQE